MSNEKKPGSGLMVAGLLIGVVGLLVFLGALASGGAGNPLLMIVMLIVGALLAAFGYRQRASRR